MSLLPNQAGGVITSGFAERGFVDSAWNPASYPGIYEAAGFTHFLAIANFGGLPHKRVLSSMELMARHVLPRLAAA